MRQVTVRALLFASLRDAASGERSVHVELEDGGTVADLSNALVERFPALRERLPLARIAVNEELTGGDRVLTGGDEVAYLPPVSGGSDGPGAGRVEVVDAEISTDEVLRSVRRPDCGAVVLFLGTVRNNFQGHSVVGMEYEAHPVLAFHALTEIAGEARARWPVKAVSIVHRVGKLALGDISVAVAVSAPHRAEAFEAGRFAIDRLKETVPIWKREFLKDGAVWIEGEDRIPCGGPGQTAQARPASAER